MLFYEIISFLKFMKLLSGLVELISLPLPELGDRSSFNFIFSMIAEELTGCFF